MINIFTLFNLKSLNNPTLFTSSNRYQGKYVANF